MSEQRAKYLEPIQTRPARPVSEKEIEVSAIARQIDSLQEVIDAAHSALGRLGDRLQPVSTPSPAMGVEGKLENRVAASPICESLYRQTHQVRGLIDRIEALVGALEV